MLSLGKYSILIVAPSRMAPALSLAVAMMLGQVIVWFLSEWQMHLFVVLTGASLLVRGAARWIPSRPGSVGLALGVMSAALAASTHPAPWSSSDAHLLVRVEERPTHRIPGEVVFVGRALLGEYQRLVRCRAVDLPWRHASRLTKGDVVWVRGAITPVSRPLNPFSWEGSQWRRGVSGEMKAIFVSSPVRQERSFIEEIRSEIRATVARTTGDTRGGALFLSMALGERDVLSSHVENSFKSVGLSHLLVVSGYQVSLVFGVVFAGCMQIRRMFGARLLFRDIAVWCALLCGAGYVCLVGSEFSSVRALIAATCLCVALVIDRPHRFAQRWATALLIMHVVYPWALFDIGVILTFAALAGIGMGSVLGGRATLWSSVWVTVCVWLLTSAVTVVWNGSFSVYGMVLNLVLAGPWSLLNCAVGGVALGCAMAHPVYLSLPLLVVALVNEWLASVVVWVANVGGSPESASGLSRILAGVVIALLSGVVGWLTLRRYRMSLMCGLLRPRYRRS